MKREEKKYKFLMIAGVLILALLVVLGLFGRKGVFQSEDVRHKKITLQAEIEKLKGENSKLKEEIRYLGNERTEIEKIARDELGLVKPGEVVYQFIEKQDIK